MDSEVVDSTPVNSASYPVLTPAALTPMIRQYLEIKSQHQDAVLFFRMGDFYEMFFDDAKRAAVILDIALTSRDRKSDNPVPMCGVPYHSADGYIAKLVERGLRVAICEQMEDPRTAKGIVKREVTRIVTPGTYIPENSKGGVAPNAPVGYVAVASVDSNNQYGLAYGDLATGEFRATCLASLPELTEEIFGLPIRELIIAETSDASLSAELERRGDGIALRREVAGLFTRGEAELCRHFGVRSTTGLGFETETAAAAIAAGALIGYLQQTQKSSLNHFDRLQLYRRNEAMVLDEATRRNLELVEPLHHWQRGGAPTLFRVLNRCATTMGERELRRWLERPLVALPAIEARLDAVGELLAGHETLLKLRQTLGEVRDLQRLTARVVLGRIGPRDISSLLLSLQRLPALKSAAQSLNCELHRQLGEQIDSLSDVVDLISRALADEPPALLLDGGVIRDGFDAELDELRRLQRQGKEWLAELEVQERQRTGIGNLKVSYNNVFGYYIEITRSNLKQVPDNYHRKQTLANAERFVTPALKDYEEKILTAGEKIAAIEARLFEKLRLDIAAEHLRLARTAEALSKLDVLQSLATAALENDYCRPRLDDGRGLRIKAGRHPVVERFLESERYVPNDVTIEAEGRRLLLVTGPNMAGKSTLLRQVALIALMAQLGSYVPADAAEIGIVDRIFTRIGAADDIAMGRSTFMVEMEETAGILRNATERSLLILDEIGRGTSTYDGLSIAWAIVEHLHDTLQARALFATHYHELIELEKRLPHARNVHVSVREQGEKVIFLHQLMEGGVSRSYGIKVARLAGLPREVLQRAEELLRQLEAVPRVPKSGVSEAPVPATEAERQQLSFFNATDDAAKLVRELQTLELEGLTPLAALNLLAAWKNEILKK